MTNREFKSEKLRREEFLSEISAVCNKYKLLIVPSYELEPSAHDPMVVVEADEIWISFLNSKTLLIQDKDGDWL